MAPALGDVGLNDLAEMFRRTPMALAVVDLSSNRLKLVNTAFADLLGQEVWQVKGRDLLSLVSTEDRGVAEQVLAVVASGLVDSCQGRARWQSPQGQAVDVVAAIRPLDASKPRARALLIA